MEAFKSGAPGRSPNHQNHMPSVLKAHNCNWLAWNDITVSSVCALVAWTCVELK